MKQIIKKFVSALLISSILSISMASSVFAGEKVVVEQTILDIKSMAQKIEADIENMDYDELQKYLMDNFGATSEEAALLAQYQEIGVSALRGFPSNPEIGDVYEGDPFTIHVAVDASVATLAGLILPKLSAAGAIVSLAEALSIAGAVLGLGSAVFGSDVRITPSYTYGYTNDGVLGWTPGYMKMEIVK